MNIVEELNSLVVTQGKLKVLNDFYINKDLLGKFNVTNNKELVLCYSVFGQMSYLKLLFFSLLTQYTFTDIVNYNIKIFVEEYWHPKVEELLGDIIGSSNIIKMPQGLCYKHHVVNHSSIKDYEVVVINDTDSFVLSDKFNSNIYSDIYNYHHQNTDTAMFAFRGKQSRQSYNAAFKNLNPNNIEYKDYRDIFSLTENYLDEVKWFHSCHFSYNSSIFNKSDIDKILWSDLILDASFARAQCDETVFITGLNKLNKNMGTINHYMEHTEVNDNLNNLDGYKLVHPLIGRYSDKEISSVFFKHIINKALEYNE